MSEDKPKKAAKKKPEPKVTKEVKKKILAEQVDKLEKTAQQIARKTMTEMQLANQVELSDEQKIAAKLIASGKSHDETAAELKKKKQEVVAWMGLPSFTRLVNELTIKEGFSDKNERIRSAKRIADELNSKLIEKIVNGEIDAMPASTLSKLAMEWAARVDNLVDKKEETSRKDLTVLILSHVQEANGKKYDKISDFLDDEDFKFPILDVDAKEISDD